MVGGICFENGKQAGGFFRQALRAFGQNVSVVNFDFNGQITHVAKLRLHPPARKQRFSLESEETLGLDFMSRTSKELKWAMF